MSDSPEIITPDKAREALYTAVRARIGADWNPDAEDDESEWWVVTGHDYMLRLTNGYQNLDFHVDLLGQVSVEEKAITPGLFSGQLLAWVLLGGSLIIALIVAQAIGWL